MKRMNVLDINDNNNNNNNTMLEDKCGEPGQLSKVKRRLKRRTKGVSFGRKMCNKLNAIIEANEGLDVD